MAQPTGPSPDALFERIFTTWYNKTWGNISPLYQLDTFDWIILIVYFAILGRSPFTAHIASSRSSTSGAIANSCPSPSGKFAEADLPLITVQLPLFNEMYVVERLLKAVTEIDYPREKLEIQVLDDSTDETVKIAEAMVAKYAAAGF